MKKIAIILITGFVLLLLILFLKKQEQGAQNFKESISSDYEKQRKEADKSKEESQKQLDGVFGDPVTVNPTNE